MEGRTPGEVTRCVDRLLSSDEVDESSVGDAQTTIDKVRRSSSRFALRRKPERRRFDGCLVAASSIKSSTCSFTSFGRFLNAFLTRRIRRLCGLQTTATSPTIPRRIPRMILPLNVVASHAIVPGGSRR